MNNQDRFLYDEALGLLKELISIPSFSKEEQGTAGAIARFFALKSIEHNFVGNNIYALNKFYDPSKPTLLLNSHHDTVKPNKSYSLDPFSPIEKEGKLFGLGSNDAGGPLVSLIACFLHFHDQQNLAYNLAIAATAEEEISGPNGIEYTMKYLPAINCAIVGEPTLMQMAVAERGLMVLDAVSQGKAGHAARNEGENAITNAMKDIEWFNSYQFPNISPLLGPVKMSVTSIESENKAHNVVPAECNFIVDIRVNERYSFEEVLDVIGSKVKCSFEPRSLRLRSSMIAEDHPLVRAGKNLGRKTYGSPTTSDKALMPFPALKMGPGDSARSHTADEFIFTGEIREGIELYIRLVEQLVNGN
jgi:acetylornithine deacetylase